MSRINVIVATNEPEVLAEAVALLIGARRDMNLVEGRCLTEEEVDKILERLTR